MLIIAVFIMAAPLCAQEVGTVDDGKEQSVIINQGIDAAKTGIVYWNAQQNNDHMLQVWSEELNTQLGLADKYVMHSPSYWTAKKYLDWAYKTRDAVKALYEATQIKELRMVLTALNRAIEAAEYLISKFVK